jgi:hypothetical protein
MKWESIGDYSLITIVMFCAGWLVKMWLESKIKSDVGNKYKKELTKFQSDLETSKDAQIEKLKSELNEKTQTAIAGLTSQLRILEAQNSVRFSRIFNKTATVIAEVYGQLLNLKETADDYTQLMEPDQKAKEALLKKFKEQMHEFLYYFTRNRIYIPKDVAEKVGNLSGTIHRAVIQYSMASAEGKSPTRNPDDYGRLFDNFFKSSSQIPGLLESLHDEFQKHLGLMEEVPPKSSAESTIDVAKILYSERTPEK